MIRTFRSQPDTQLVITESTTVLIATKPRLLICETTGSSVAMLGPLRAEGYGVEVAKVARPFSSQMRTDFSSFDILLLDVTTSSRDVLEGIDALNASIGICSVRPRLLCFSTAHRNPHFVIALQRCGARYVRVTCLSILLEAIELLFAEMNELRRNGPCFQIIHRFSQGSCAPGEEVSGALLTRHGEFFQLPLRSDRLALRPIDSTLQIPQ